MKPLSIIIPALNEEHYLPRLLQSFTTQKSTGLYEVIVVDGGSTDDTAAVVKKYQKVLPTLSLYRSKRGVAKQRNYGAKKAKYESLIFLDADMELPENALLKIERHFQTKTDFVAVPGLFPYDGKMRDIFFFLTSVILFWVVRNRHPIIAGMCVITTKQVHERIGGFNENAIVAEDLDYGFRAFRSGARYYMLFNVIIRASARRAEKMGRLKLGRLWYKWYVHNIKYGAITKKDAFEYEFGNFKATK
jgi:glycosyltransferase involved in cell wall biosynthesis